MVSCQKFLPPIARFLATPLVVTTMIHKFLAPTILLTHSGMVLVVLVAPAVPSTLLHGSVRTCLHQLLMILSYVSVWISLYLMNMYCLIHWSSTLWELSLV